MKAKKFITAITAAALAIAGGLSGCKGIGKKEKIVKYTLTNYTFELSSDFTRESPDDIREVYDCTVHFSGKHISSMSISGDGTSSCTPAYAAESYYNDELSSSESEEVTRSEVKAGDLTVYAVHLTRKNAASEDERGESYYTTSKESQVFCIYAYYAPADKESAIKELDKIASTAVRTSNYKLPTTPQTYDTPYYTMKDYSPRWAYKESKADGEKILSDASFYLIEASNEAETYSRVNVTVHSTEKSGTAAELADQMYEKDSNKDEQLVQYEKLERSQAEFLGRPAEVLTSTVASKYFKWDMTEYWVDCGERVFCISIRHKAEDSSTDSLLNDLIGSVELK